MSLIEELVTYLYHIIFTFIIRVSYDYFRMPGLPSQRLNDLGKTFYRSQRHYIIMVESPSGSAGYPSSG